MTFLRDRSRRLPLLLAGIAALLMLNTAISATRYLSIENKLRLPMEDSLVWAATQLEVELARFLVALDQFGNGAVISREQLVERFDVTWSRLGLFLSGGEGRWLDEHPQHKPAIERLRADLETVGQAAFRHRARQRRVPRHPRRTDAASSRDQAADRRGHRGRGSRPRRPRARAGRPARGDPDLLVLALAAFFGLAFYLVRAESLARKAVKDLSRARAEAEAASERLSEAIANISEGFVIYDANDRLVLCNAKYREYYGLSASVIRAGSTFEEILRAGVALGQYEDAKADPEAFVAERLRRRRSLHEPFEQLLGDGPLADGLGSAHPRWRARRHSHRHHGDQAARDGARGGQADPAAAGGGVAPARGARAEGERSEVGIPRHAEPRNPHADERRGRPFGSPGGPAAGGEVGALRRGDQRGGKPAPAPHQHHPRPVAPRGGRAELDVSPFALHDTLQRVTAVAAALASSKPVQVSRESAAACPSS